MPKIENSQSRIKHLDLGSPDVGAVADVLAAVTDDGTEQTITTGFTDPPTPRNVTASTDGTADDIAAVQVIVNGTNAEGAAISETLPVFTENTKTTVVGAKAFATITSVVIPVHDDTGATTSIGLGNLLGLGVRLSRDTVLAAYFGGVRESTAPTIAFSASALESNTASLDSTLDESAVLIDCIED